MWFDDIFAVIDVVATCTLPASSCIDRFICSILEIIHSNGVNHIITPRYFRNIIITKTPHYTLGKNARSFFHTYSMYRNYR